MIIVHRAKIYFLNLDINNFDLIYQDNSEEIDNFFIKAISRLKNENSYTITVFKIFNELGFPYKSYIKQHQ